MKKIALLLEEFDVSISEIKKSNLDKLTVLNKKIKVTNDCLQQFRVAIRNNDFSSQKDEIKFFKYQKPYIQGRLQYYTVLNHYLLKLPFANLAQQCEFINTQLNELDTKNCIQLEFVKYYRLEENRFDHLFFLRGNNQFDMFTDTSRHYDDPEFSTNHDYLAAQIITRELLSRYYSNELDILKRKDTNIIIKEVKPTILKDLTWKGSKTDLIELLFALKASGVLSSGNPEMKKLVEICEELFGIELGNIHKTFGQIKAREKDPTKFLDLLKFNLIQKINSEL